jgi:hypothetical protein
MNFEALACLGGTAKVNDAHGRTEALFEAIAAVCDGEAQCFRIRPMISRAVTSIAFKQVSSDQRSAEGTR